MPTGRIQHRIDPTLQREAELILKTQGIKPSQAIYLFYMEIKRFGGLPFRPTPVRPSEIPNAKLQKDIREARQGKGVWEFRDKKSFLNALHDLKS
ncbi:type II toxin-antitoxin system RelB/DinJ family antitoxin [Candidatus Peregrinibacteria bacterium]|nr:type II toxin-antitoxin system RelB/DinJ family antitoxin [Candidatus Peregrinibacteria bacterium]